MKTFFITIAAVLLTAAFLPGVSYSHSGGTNAAGCHTNRKTGDYHCHNPKPRDPGRTTYCHVVGGESRCGYAESTCEDLAAEFGGYCKKE